MKFLMGFLLGFAAGAATALLYAPSTGEEMRARLSSGATTEWELAQSQLHKGVEGIQGQLASVQAQLQTLAKQQEKLEEQVEPTEATEEEEAV